MIRAAWVVALIGLGGCGFEIPPANHLHGTELLMIRHAVELGPLGPERVGPSFVGMDELPIAEMLPGDRVTLEPVVVDIDGHRLPASELDTLWLQCGYACNPDYFDYDYSHFEVPCGEQDFYSAGDDCRLGTSDGRFEFEFPPLAAPSSYLQHPQAYMVVYGVVAWDGRTAEDCWAERRGARGDLDGCGFIYHALPIGPTWQALVLAGSLGLETPFDPAEIPSWALWQPANRIPRTPKLWVSVDHEWVAEGVPPLPPIEVEPGARIDVSLAFDPFTQSLQRRFAPLKPGMFDAWRLIDERVHLRAETSGWIRQVGDPEPYFNYQTLSFEVDVKASGGSSRVLIIFDDNRGGHDLLTLEFELR